MNPCFEPDGDGKSGMKKYWTNINVISGEWKVYMEKLKLSMVSGVQYAEAWQMSPYRFILPLW